MTWRLSHIKAAYDMGNDGKHSHMIVGHDTYDNSNYPIYVPMGEDPRDHLPKSGRVDEVYSYALGWEAQSHGRVMNWD